MSETADVISMPTPTEFDPAIHATDKEGNPRFNKDGSLRKRRSDAGARSSAPKTAKAPNNAHKRYFDGVSGLMQIASAGVAMASPVDGFCVAQHTPPIANAVADLAVDRPEVAAALDKILAVGPYGALIGAVLPLVVQIAHNHNRVPEEMAKALGATPKSLIENHLRSEAEKMAQAQHAQAA